MSAISPATDLCGIFLHPASHTRSPAMHNAAFRELGVDAVYLAFDVAPASLAEALRGAWAMSVRQLAISIPHKEAVIEHAASVDDTARAIGAANTLTHGPEGWAATNTDWRGLVAALEREGSLDGRRAAVLGAGGTARAAVFGLQQRGATVTVLNRTAARASALATDFPGTTSGALDELGDLEAEVVVNTTSVGMGEDASPVDARMLHERMLVFDAVYEPERTRLLQDAEAAGARTVSGKWMLIEQAIHQIQIWTKQTPKRETLESAFDAAG